MHRFSREHTETTLAAALPLWKFSFRRHSQKHTLSLVRHSAIPMQIFSSSLKSVFSSLHCCECSVCSASSSAVFADACRFIHSLSSFAPVIMEHYTIVVGGFHVETMLQLSLASSQKCESFSRSLCVRRLFLSLSARSLLAH
jgi:hypothetical protein